MAAIPEIRDADAQQQRVLILVCYLGFVSLGLPDALIGVAWPSIRRAFSLEQSAISWIFFGGGCSYFVSSFFAGRLLKIWRVGTLLSISSGFVAVSAFNYALAPVWFLFALGSLFHGLGSGAIDSGLNHYVATHFSARQMNWLHASYSLGAMLGPALMTWMIARENSWRAGYLIVGGVLLALSLLFAATRRQWNSRNGSGAQHHASVSVAQVLSRGKVWLHIVLFFVYTGLEVAVGQWSFTFLTESRGVPTALAGTWVTIYWASILAGRVLFGFLADRVSIDILVRWSTILALIGTALFAWNPFPSASPIALALSGLGLAVIFPSLMTRTPQRFGPEAAAHAIGFQVGAAMLGAASLPSAVGFAAKIYGVAVAPAILLAAAGTLLMLHESVLASERAGE